MTLSINSLNTADPDFESRLDALLAVSERDGQVEQVVSEIIAGVRASGDQALLEYTRQFQSRHVNDIHSLIVTREQMKAAVSEIPAETMTALQTAAKRIRQYAQQQKLQDWNITDTDGNTTGQKIMPLDSVGLYIPGGKAVYPSSVLMTAIPAKVAGVPRVVAVVPSVADNVDPLVRASAYLCEVDELYAVGGAQAIAALAYGTETIKAVDKIVGPGNQYVTEAKRQVFGKVGIDMLAGPSEIVVVSDHSTPPEWVAADLFAQAEHDEQARAILISTDPDFMDAVLTVMRNLIKEMPRADIIKHSLSNCGAFICVRDLKEAARIVNKIAPEHLMLTVESVDSLLADIRHAGAVFLGAHSPEVFGDYCAGPDHVLPTGTAARFSSPLGVYDFQKRTSIIQCSSAGAGKLAGIAGHLAECEGLFAHAQSAYCRRNGKSNK